jgi:hypothetical protein
MKFKLKDIDFNTIKYSEPVLFENSKLLNLSISDEIMEFQTPRVIIENIVEQNLVLKFLPNEASKIFYSKIIELENHFSKKYPSYCLKNNFKNDTFTVKVPYRYSKPCIKVYFGDSQFNYYNLKKDTEIICLLSCDKIWINNDKISYNLNVKEILITKLT